MWQGHRKRSERESGVEMNLPDSCQLSDTSWVTHLADLRPITSRERLRKIALDGLSFFDACAGRNLKKMLPRVQFVLFHHVFKDEVEAFCKLLATLQKDFKFISYSEAVTRVLEGRADRPYLAFSFDDGQKCSLQAAEVLEKFGASACFFVCPALIGETNPTTIAAFCRKQLWHAPVEFMDWKDLQQLRDRGHEIGGHTINHVNLGSTAPSRVDEEVGLSFEILEKIIGPQKHFSWPYGHFQHFSQQAAEAVFRSGYRSCASAVRGSHAGTQVDGAVSDATQLCLYRDSIVANWPISHVQYFLRRAARQPIANEQTWPNGFRPHSTGLTLNARESISPLRNTNREAHLEIGTTTSPLTTIPCESPSTPSPCDPAAA